MIEISKIFFIFPIFLLLLVVPFCIFDKNNGQFKFTILNLNLLINLNLLLIFSFFTIAITSYQIIFLSLYFLFFLFQTINLKFYNFKFYNGVIFFLFIFTFIIYSMVIASELNLGWDAKYFYYIKSLFFAEGLNLSELNNFEHNKWHPHFGSYIWAFFWKLPFFDLEYYGRLFYLFIFCFAILYLVFSTNFNIYLKSILFLLIIILTFNYERFSGLQEIIIFSLLIISSKILFDLEKRKKLEDIFVLFLISNLIIWTKSEGIVYAFIILFVMISNRKLNLSEKIYIIFTFLLLICFKNIMYLHLNFDLNSQPYNLNFIFSLDYEAILFRIKNIIIYGAYYSIKNIFFILGGIVLALLNFNKKNKFKIKIFNIYFILNTLFILFAYLFREMEIIYALRTTMERVIFTSSGFYIYLLLLYTNNHLKINK